MFQYNHFYCAAKPGGYQEDVMAKTDQKDRKIIEKIANLCFHKTSSDVYDPIAEGHLPQTPSAPP